MQSVLGLLDEIMRNPLVTDQRVKTRAGFLASRLRGLDPFAWLFGNL